MSKRKDRERAESGLIFRNGRLWNKEEWYAIHPTRGMVNATKERVAMAVDTELKKKFAAEPYHCTRCGHVHRPDTKIYLTHLPHAGKMEPQSLGSAILAKGGS